MSKQKTHRLVKEPRVSDRYLADYMAATETAQRSIIRNCKYPPIARIVQHDLAKKAIGRFVWKEGVDLDALSAEAEAIRNRMTDDDFDRDVLDHNADYIERFVEVEANIDVPDADFSPPGVVPPIEIEGVKLTADIHWRARRVTRTNKIRIGAGTLRYSKGKALSEAVGLWQSAFIFGYLRFLDEDEYAEPEQKLCITVDAYAGVAYAAPSNSVQRFSQMQSACATIAERWPNIPPPPNAVL